MDTNKVVDEIKAAISILVHESLPIVVIDAEKHLDAALKALNSKEDTISQHEHKAYDIADGAFRRFVKNNKSWLDHMKEGRMVNIVAGHKDKPIDIDIRFSDVLWDLWNVKFIGKRSGLEGPHIIFLDEDWNKIYSYHDVE